MPVTIRPASHPPKRWVPRQARSSEADSAATLFRHSCRKESDEAKQVIRSSFGDGFGQRTISSSPNGLVWAAYEAYSNHHHLTIRPEDVWFAVLSQFSFYVNAHSEELRTHFVAHEGKKEVEVSAVGNLHTVDIGDLAVQLTKEMEKFIVDPELRDWIMPSFTTTTDTDTVTASVLMMGTLQKYFEFKMSLMCGIPSVTLLGERDDWAKLQKRLDKLTDFGDEPKQFASLLTPVLGYFIRSYDEPESAAVIDFWSRIADKSGGSGPHYLSGWITAFCFWDVDGGCMYKTPVGEVNTRSMGGTAPGCNLDGVLFHRVDIGNIPAGYTSAPVTVDDNGLVYKTKMVAGSVGIQGWSSGEYLDEPNAPGERVVVRRGEPDTSRQVTGLDSIQPLSGWWMYELKDGE